MTEPLDESPENAENNAPADDGKVDSKPADTEGAAAATAATEAGKPDARDKVQERFDKLTREKYEGLSRAERAEYRAQELERRLADIEAKQPAPTSQVAPDNDYPTLESVGWDEDKHRAAVAQWNAKQIRDAAKAEIAAEREAARAAETQTAWDRKQTEFQKIKPEYAEKVLEGARRNAWALSKHMLEVAQASDIGPEILLYLAENADKSREIYRLPPHLQAAEMGEIRARLRAAKAPPPPPVSSAPPPPPKVEGSAPAEDKPDAELTDKEWERKQDRIDRLKKKRA